MGIGRAWRVLKVLKATGQAANEAAAQASAGQPGSLREHGMGAAVRNFTADAMTPAWAVSARYRGGPLPGSDPAVIDGSAWARPVAAGADAVRARDAAFDAALLESFAGQVFSAVAPVAWMQADAGGVRPVLSDALWEPLAAVAGRRGGRVPDVGPVRQLAMAELRGLHAGTWYDSAMAVMHVRWDFGGQRPPADMTAEMMRWDEDWLFQRSARPGGDPMIRPPACPTCGAPTLVDEAGLCTHCGVPVPFLTTGWLAAGIASRHPRYAMTRQGLDPESMSTMSPRLRALWLAAYGRTEPPGWAS